MAGSPADVDKPSGPPPWWVTAGEPLALREFPRLLLRVPSLLRQPRGEGRPVLVLPGFGAGDASTASLRGYLGTLGYSVRGWGLGINRGNVPTLMRSVLELLDAFANSAAQPVALVGWSLGGVLAREAARERPDTVQQVITMGSPIVGGPRYSVVAPWFQRQGFDFDAIERRIEERNRIPIRVPITAMYSRRDGVVAWQACIDRQHPHARNIEVFSTHTGLGFDPDVYQVVASRLGGFRS